MSTDGSSMSEETLAEFANVKKGKDRRFVMLVKGGKIQSLVLFKRGSIEAIKKEAKKSGSGVPCHGQVSGKGDQITFAVAISDGFTEPPVKDVPLKAFLIEAKVKARPTFEVVKSHKPIADEDENESESESEESPTKETPEKGAETSAKNDAPSPPNRSAEVGAQGGDEQQEEEQDEEQPSKSSSIADAPDIKQFQWEQQATKLKKLVELCEAKKFNNFAALKLIYEKALKRVEAGDYATALEAAAKIQDFVKKATAPSPSAQTAGPDSAAEAKKPAANGDQPYGNYGVKDEEQESEGQEQTDRLPEQQAAAKTSNYLDDLPTNPPPKATRNDTDRLSEEETGESGEDEGEDIDSDVSPGSEDSNVPLPNFRQMWRSADAFVDHWQKVLSRAEVIQSRYSQLAVQERPKNLDSLATDLQEMVMKLLPEDGNYDKMHPERIKFIQEMSTLASSIGDFNEDRLNDILGKLKNPIDVTPNEGEGKLSNEQIEERRNERKSVLIKVRYLDRAIQDLSSAVEDYSIKISKTLGGILKEAQELEGETALSSLFDNPEFRTGPALRRLETLAKNPADRNPELTALRLKALRAAEAVNSAQSLHRDNFLGKWEKWYEMAARMSAQYLGQMDAVPTDMPVLKKAVAELHMLAEKLG